MWRAPMVDSVSVGIVDNATGRWAIHFRGSAAIAAAVAAFGFVFTFRDVPTPPHLNGTAETPEDEQ